MNILRYLLLFLIGTASLSGAEHANWLTDFDKAQAQARQEGKFLLMEFTGSDWCPPCKALAKEVLETSKFAGWAKNSQVVLLKLDFPRKTPLSEAQSKHNRQIQEKFKIEGYPTLIVLDPSGKEVARTSGYNRGAPEDVYTWLKTNTRKTAATK